MSDYLDDQYSVLSAALTDPSLATEPQRSSITTPDCGGSVSGRDSVVGSDAYKSFPWARYPGYQIPEHSKRGLTAWIWKYGYRIQLTKDGSIHWACRLCIEKNVPKPTQYKHTNGTHRPIGHLRDQHKIDENGIIVKRRRIEEGLKNTTPLEQAVINAQVANFDPQRWKRALVRWMAYDHVKLRQVDTEPLQRMIQCANKNINKDTCLPTRQTVREWIIKDFELFKPHIIELLKSTNNKINITFDLWTSSNTLSLNGIIAHFIDEAGKIRRFLLSVPEVDGRHTGVNIAAGVAKIIREFDIANRIGYFVVDNAGNNDTAIENLVETFDFRAEERRLRCAAHVFSRVCQQIMYGHDLEAFKHETERVKDLEEQLQLWRKKGPLGRLYNIIMWITDKHADSNRAKAFRELQQQQNATVPFDDNSNKHLDLKRPNDTRWNSHYDAYERVVKLRITIEQYCLNERHEYEHYLTRIQRRNAGKEKQKKPDPPNVMITDVLSNDDWLTVAEFMEILQPFKKATKKLEGANDEGELCY